ncbi:preprotein translocase subunit YajC [Iodidimonas nitroreducens]|uniref:Sec translocon accessory complex subunit YajC n=2 Tax=Iodidimonas nitroreducens TaxID=1236968 RepID=A0A5A7N468_9PROT|nr:immunogenic membrane protein YajC [alpha proteobacterium Q-1]GER02797.1 preprotein translocase subunit YajC [Iodidimonas nitroreducens]
MEMGFFMLISTAYAQSAGGAAGGGLLEMLLPLALIMLIFYFLLIRPQQKRLKEHRNLIAAIRRGDTVVTSGGLIGKVTKVADDELQVEVSEGVRLRVVRGTIAEVRGKAEPAES